MKKQPGRGLEWRGSLEELEARRLLAGDHPSLADFPTATSINLVFQPGNNSFVGDRSGEVGQLNDDDLFQFLAPATGRIGIVVAQTEVGGLAPAVRLLSAAGQPLTQEFDGSNGLAAVWPMPLEGVIVEGQTYYINVRAGQPSDTNEPSSTGGYRVVIVLEPGPPGSHEPPPPDTPRLVALSSVTGGGSVIDLIGPAGDRDTFVFDALARGEVRIEVETPGSQLDPQVTVRNTAGQLVAFTPGDADGASVTINASGRGDRYFVTVDADDGATPATDQGGYVLRITGRTTDPPPPPPIPDPRPTDEEFDAAVSIAVSYETGLGSMDDSIGFVGDSDLYRVSAARAGRAFALVERVSGSGVRASVRVFDATRNLIAYDWAGMPGRLASVEFDAAAGQEYFLWVQQQGNELGGYGVRVELPPAEYVLYYPEGYSAATIDEFVPMVNPNGFAVEYTVIARYEIGERDQVVATGTIGPNSRGGITISTRNNPGGALVRRDEPYALEVHSTGQLGATLSHYDFGSTTGENFTDHVSQTWTFALAHRDPAVFRDFLVFANPGESDATLTISVVYDDGQVTTFTRTLGALRRGGVNFTTDSALERNGRFAVRIDSDRPIVAALTSYDIGGGRGYGLLGAPEGGSRSGAIPLFSDGSGADAALSIFNGSASGATVTITASYAEGAAPDTVRELTVPAHSRRTVAAQELGLLAAPLAGLRYVSSTEVTVASAEYQNGDGDSTAAGTAGALTSVFADAFVNPDLAGIAYIETLAIYNPAPVATPVQVSLLLPTGYLGSINLMVGGHGFAYLRLDQLQLIRQLSSPAAFSVRLDAASPVIGTLTHYDLYLNGGWASAGAPMGLTTGFGMF